MIVNKKSNSKTIQQALPNCFSRSSLLSLASRCLSSTFSIGEQSANGRRRILIIQYEIQQQHKQVFRGMNIKHLLSFYFQNRSHFLKSLLCKKYRTIKKLQMCCNYQDVKHSPKMDYVVTLNVPSKTAACENS